METSKGKLEIMKDVNIVIVNYLRKEEIFKNLDSLFNDLVNTFLDVQVILVDNSLNKDGIKEDLKNRFEQVLYLNPGENLGFGKGNNFGFKEIQARYYFALNPDIIFLQSGRVVEKMVEFMDKNQQIGCIGPKLVNTDGTVQNSCYRFNFSSIFIKPLRHSGEDRLKFIKKHVDNLVMRDFEHNTVTPVDWVLGAALFARAEAIKKAGWFDERYFMYLEDADLCHKMWNANFPVYYVHHIILEHKHKRESAKVSGVVKGFLKNKLARVHLVSWVKYIWKWRNNFKYYGKLS